MHRRILDIALVTALEERILPLSIYDLTNGVDVQWMRLSSADRFCLAAHAEHQNILLALPLQVTFKNSDASGGSLLVKLLQQKNTVALTAITTLGSNVRLIC